MCIPIITLYIVAKLQMRPAALNTAGNKRRKVDVLKLRTQSNIQQYKDQLHSNLDNMASPYKWTDIVAAYTSLGPHEKADEVPNNRKHAEAYWKLETN